MSITEEISFDNTGKIETTPIWKKLFLALVIILVATLSFGIGRVTVVGKSEPIKIEYDPEISNQASVSNALNTIENSKLKIENSMSVVASKSSSKYHYLHCAGAKQIKEANKLTFSTPQAAEAAGYSLAANCVAK